MDKIYKRSVDIYSLEIKYPEASTLKPTIEQLLRDPQLIEGDLKIKQKFVSFHLLESNDKYIVGLVETNRDDNIPPRKKRKEKIIEKLDFPEGDGLVFGNVFLFDITNQVILYEVNKNGSILQHFIEFLYRKLPEYRRQYGINSTPVLTRDQNIKLQKMTTKTRIEVQIAHPRKVAKEVRGSLGALGMLFSKAAELNTTKLNISFSVNATSKAELNPLEANRVISEIEDQINKDKQGVLEHLTVYGYIDDGRDKRIDAIDLVTDRLKGEIELREPRLAENLLDLQRKTQIIGLYDSLEDEIIAIFKK